MAVRLLRKTVNHRQAKSRSLSQRFSREERIERAREHVRAHAASRVGNRNTNVVTGRKRRGIGQHAFEMRIGRADPQLAAIRHRIARIDRKIKQRAFELIGIAQRIPKIVGRGDI